MCKPILLIGMMGCGKSTIGRLARRARSADPLGGEDRRGSRHSAYRRLGKRFQRSELYLFQFLGRGRLGTLPQTLPET